MPNGPMSERRMISSASFAGRRLPRPSARSARPSMCSPRVSRTCIATITTAATSADPCPLPCHTSNAGSMARAARRAPMTGIHSTARVAPRGPRSGRPAGRTVNIPIAARNPLIEAAAGCRRPGTRPRPTSRRSGR